ncbi:MAG: hypothetical protein ABSF45_12835 [Terriglobia bacterium]
MNPRTKRFLSGPDGRCWRPHLLAFGLLALGVAGGLIAGEQSDSSDLTVHEWGTFTAIAGKDGQAVEWTPFTGSTDLPGFVEHLTSANLKAQLRGTIRMETPVLYFYSPRDATVSVSVAFSKGIITEWYPRAVSVEPVGIPLVQPAAGLPPGGMLFNTSLSRRQSNGSITWSNVAVSPNLTGEFPREDAANRYYAARETSSAPLRVNTSAGEQREKFLFYRGVSGAPLPLSAVQNSEGKLAVKSFSGEEIPALILFERRGERTGYRLARALTDETVLDPPELTGSVDALGGDLEGVLVDQGLYPDEAHAMVSTWRDSWFEEGSRLIYIVPRGFIDNILPLTIQPPPAQIVRVFVGRLEIVTPATTRAVETAMASNDTVSLEKYGRFLEPILQIASEEHPATTRER